MEGGLGCADRRDRGASAVTSALSVEITMTDALISKPGSVRTFF